MSMKCFTFHQQGCACICCKRRDLSALVIPCETPLSLVSCLCGSGLSPLTFITSPQWTEKPGIQADTVYLEMFTLRYVSFLSKPLFVYQLYWRHRNAVMYGTHTYLSKCAVHQLNTISRNSHLIAVARDWRGTNYMIFKCIAEVWKLFRNKLASVRDVEASKQICMYINSVLHWDELPSKALLCHLI